MTALTTLRLPFRGDTADRPRGLPLPPARLPLFRAGRMLKHWRYISIWSESIMICAARVHVGPVQQEFWGVWDRRAQRLYGRTRLLPGRVQLRPNRVTVHDQNVQIDVTLDENAGLEVLTPDGEAYTWTRKQSVRAHGSVVLDGESCPVEAIALIDDNAGYHPRHTVWQWSGGAGLDAEGRQVSWSVIVGLNDSPENSGSLARLFLPTISARLPSPTAANCTSPKKQSGSVMRICCSFAQPTANHSDGSAARCQAASSCAKPTA
jgi:hypothetical protein